MGTHTLNNPCFDDSVTSIRMPQLNSQKRGNKSTPKNFSQRKVCTELVLDIFSGGVDTFLASSHCNFRPLTSRQKVFQNFSDKFDQIAQCDHHTVLVEKSTNPQNSIYIKNFPKVHYRICIQIVRERSNSFNMDN